ncbi:MAG: hypothetical protein AB1633_05675, partial [Elusimicrobiota bacterium]
SGKFNVAPEKLSGIIKFAAGSVSRAIELFKAFEDDSSTGDIFFESKILKSSLDGSLKPEKIIEKNERVFSNRQGAEKFFNNLLILMHIEIEKEHPMTPQITGMMEKIIDYKKSLRYNVNPALTVDILLYDLSETFRRK